MAYREMYEIEVEHEELNKYRLIRGSNEYVVERKALAQELAWDEMWEKKQAIEKSKQARETAMRSKEEKKELAKTKTNESQQSINLLETTLLHTIKIDDTIDWDKLLNKKKYPEEIPVKPKLKPPPPKPNWDDLKFQPIITFWDKIFVKPKKRKEEEAEREFEDALKSWESKNEKIQQKNEKTKISYKQSIKKWKEKKLKYHEKQEKGNKQILERKDQYLSKDSDLILEYCDMVLANSEYPDYFPQEWFLDYQVESKILLIDYSLPDKDSLPTVKTVKYVISRDEFTETHLSQAALNKLYDGLLYQIALRTIHELYEADVVNGLESVVFNGWVDSVDKATGQNTNACIMSLQASKDEFLEINLGKVDPKACFKRLKGVGSSKLHGLSPVAPIISIDKEDRRFVSAYDVVDGVADSDNLAAMDWQDFENLIREIFEKEFVSSGGEVKITQASRDGGVDAIAFDPDPIRGGKIVIQAKRYTNVVGVSAVRDLYGTTVNEGATKGILVTTADYGPDAYKFAKGKPLTLLNGSNLLYLLDKHGHKAKIDLKEAKKLFAEQKK